MKSEEPLAIYYARLMRNGRVVIPEGTRTFLRLSEGDNVEVKVKPSDKNIVARFITKVGKRGLIQIPKDVREKLGITHGTWLEITLLSVYKPLIVGDPQ